MNRQVDTGAIADTVAALHAASWKRSYRGIHSDHYLDHEVDAERLAYWKKHVPELIVGEGEIFLATMQGKPAGFLCMEIGPEKEWGAMVDNLHVLPSMRGANIGGQLLDRGAVWARKRGQTQLYLWVYELNHDARRFYAREGWRQVEQVSAAVPGGQERIVLRLIKPL